MATVAQLGVRFLRAATGAAGKVAVGETATGQGIIVARTNKGEGYTLYRDRMAALSAYGALVRGAGLIELGLGAI